MTKEQIFQIFGHISVFYSTLDFFVTVFIFDIVNEEYKSINRPLRDDTTLGTKLRIIKELEESNVTSIESLQKSRIFIDEAILVSKERNRFIHDNWSFAPTDLNQGRISRMSLINLGKWGIDTEHSDFYTMEDLENLLSRLGKLQCDFLDARKLIR